ncbi:Sensor histidine kinase/response regulator [hydrothermal vent metagenome]|uniref:Sensor histidine kinase/response regulator n=1 Tax=hydrothermal vent metagenome TaxID=652676 RepID=A0A3B1D892_9ZZZZ
MKPKGHRLFLGKMLSFVVFLLPLLQACDLQGLRPVSPRTPTLKSERTGPPPLPKDVIPHSQKQSAQKHYDNYGLIGSFSTGPQSYVRSLFSDDDTVWVGTTEGIIQVETRTGDPLKTYSMREGLLSPYVFAINKGPAGQYWFGTNNGGLSLFDGETFKNYLPSDGLADFWVYGIDFAADGTAWIATWNGVSHFDGKQFTNYNTADGLADRWVYAIAVDQDGAVWFGTEGGVSRRDNKGRWKSWRHKDGLGAPNKNRLLKSENTGFGTQINPKQKDDYAHTHDLSVLDPAGQETYNKNYVFSMAIDREGNRWFGTWGGGASRFDGTTWQNFTTENGLAGNIVYDVTIDPHDGAIWFGTNHGVSRFDGKNWMSIKAKDGLANENVYAVAIDKHRRLWLGEKGGVDVWAPQE